MRCKETWNHFFNFLQICDGLLGREWLLTLLFLPGEFRGQRSLEGYSSWGQKGQDTTERPTLLQRITRRQASLHFCKVLFRGKTLENWTFYRCQPLPLLFAPVPPSLSHSLHSMHRMKFQVDAKFESLSCPLGPNTLHLAPSLKQYLACGPDALINIC